MEKIIKEHNTQEMYDKLLVDLLPNLERYSYLSGSEGRVFFVSDDYVVKEYYFHNYIDDETFESYCEEIKSFAEQGLSVPKIYAWTKFKQEYHITPRFYILEERVKGKHLFNEIADLYPRLKDRMTPEEFHKGIYDSQNNKELYSQILIEYLNHINENLSEIANMTDENIENFVTSLYELYTTGNYSYPDLYEENILFDGKKFILIDQHMRTSLVSPENEEDAKTNIIIDFFILFERLYSAIYITRCLDINLQQRVDKAKRLIEKNKYDIALKFSKKIKSVLAPMSAKKFFNPTKHFLDENRAKQIVDELEKI